MSVSNNKNFHSKIFLANIYTPLRISKNNIKLEDNIHQFAIKINMN